MFLPRLAVSLFAPALFALAGCGSSGGGNDTENSTGGPSIVTVEQQDLGEAGISHFSSPDSTGTTTFVAGPDVPPYGQGSVEMTTGPNGDGAEELRFEILDGEFLSSITALDYWTYIGSGSGSQAPYLLVRVDWNGDGTQDDSIFFEPEYQHGYTTNVPDQGDLVLGMWQSWDARQGGWWSNNDPAFGPGAGVRPLAEYAAAHPGSQVTQGTSATGGLRLVVGYGAPPWNDFEGNVDGLRVAVNGIATIYDFD